MRTIDISRCYLCNCPNHQHGSNGFIDWCESENCPGVAEWGGAPCITDYETGVRAPAYYTGDEP